MVIIPEKEVLIITPPHTGSGSITKTFNQKVYGPNPDGNIDHHFASLHNSYLNWRKILIVRKPFQRLVGLYEHAKQTMGLKGDYWDLFCYNTFAGNNNWFFGWTITKIMKYYIPEFKKEDFEIWPMERFPELPTGIVGDMGPPYHSFDYSKYEKNKDLINIWGKEDLNFYDSI